MIKLSNAKLMRRNKNFLRMIGVDAKLKKEQELLHEQGCFRKEQELVHEKEQGHI
jgi:hypothetical protein